MNENLNIGYLVTDENDISFPSHQWSKDVIHNEENSNYFFQIYHDLNIAKFIQPALEQYKKPNFWKVKYSDVFNKGTLRTIAKTCQALEKCDNTEPNDEQRFNFSALLSLNYIKNKVFVDWALQYMKNQDRTTETADAVSEKIRLNMYMDIPDDQTYVASIHALINAVVTKEYRFNCAASAYKLITDAPPQLYPEAFASTTLTTSTEKLLEIVESSI